MKNKLEIALCLFISTFHLLASNSDSRESASLAPLFGGNNTGDISGYNGNTW